MLAYVFYFLNFAILPFDCYVFLRFGVSSFCFSVSLFCVVLAFALCFVFLRFVVSVFSVLLAFSAGSSVLRLFSFFFWLFMRFRLVSYRFVCFTFFVSPFFCALYGRHAFSARWLTDGACAIAILHNPNCRPASLGPP